MLRDAEGGSFWKMSFRENKISPSVFASPNIV